MEGPLRDAAVPRRVTWLPSPSSRPLPGGARERGRSLKPRQRFRWDYVKPKSFFPQALHNRSSLKRFSPPWGSGEKLAPGPGRAEGRFSRDGAEGPRKPRPLPGWAPGEGPSSGADPAGVKGQTGPGGVGRAGRGEAGDYPLADEPQCGRVSP